MNQFLSLTLRGGAPILVNVARITDISTVPSNGATLICFGGPEEANIEVGESLEWIRNALDWMGDSRVATA